MSILSRKANSHTVTPRDGYYEVTSGASGRTYRVAPIGGERAVCDCAARVPQCSHVLAVLVFAREVLRSAARGEVAVVLPSAVESAESSTSPTAAHPAQLPQSTPGGVHSAAGSPSVKAGSHLEWIFRRIGGSE